MLLRTQSTPMLSTASHASFKAVVAAAGSGGYVEKPEKECFDRTRLGRGKENIPPKKDQENDDNAPRKRLRMTSRGSFSDASGRRRSGSVVSVRSETSGESCLGTTCEEARLTRIPFRRSTWFISSFHVFFFHFFLGHRPFPFSQSQ